MEHRRNSKLIISKGHLRRLVNREVLRHRLREASSNSCTVHIESEGNYPSTLISPESMPVDLEDLSPNHNQKPSISEICTDNSTDSGRYTEFRHSNTYNDNINTHGIGEFLPSTSSDLPKNTFEYNMTCWIIKNRSSLGQSSINDLLSILVSYGFNFPKDTRTLLETPKTCKLSSIAGGEYKHFSISQSLKKLFKNNVNSVATIIQVEINIDGLPLTKSSTSQFWPILMSVDYDGCQSHNPFIVGLYHGYSKPTNIDEYLREFISEFKDLEKQGLYLDNGRQVQVQLVKIVCDAPAKSLVLGVKGHTGYSSCTKCTQEGEYVNGRVTFPELNAPLRTDETFRNKVDEEYHQRLSPFEELSIGLVTGVPLDYMHLVCLGVMKRLVLFWMKGRQDVRISNNFLPNMQDNINKIKRHIPKEFARYPRNLTEVDRFKASEFRQLLLYTGPYILANLLSKTQYIHFLTLHVAIRILCSKDLLHNYLNSASDLLNYFVCHFGDIYGHEYVSHNVHNLIHLPNDCRRHGCLDNFSSFKYENFLYKMKKMVKCSRYPLQQIVNRFEEIELLKTKHENRGPKLESALQLGKSDDKDCYKRLVLKNLILTTSERDNCVILTDSTVVVVDCIYKDKQDMIKIQGRKCIIVGPLYEKPCNSLEIFNMCVVQEMPHVMPHAQKTFLISDIKHKCMKLPKGDNLFIVIPLLHNEIQDE
ncbi:unnamed protein product [Callosobruchus maculatus]|uniref:Transposase domain-containing protein n=1 Tax=Callosobruchus maculatus TaxID=64391 RepID=A0A653DA25_CALMS|nr:unnamed protein product [Callosobruchus maculatus]